MRGKEARRLQRVRRLTALRQKTAAGSPSAPEHGAAIPAGDTPATDPYVGTILADRYRILTEVGRGSMGTVYLGEHTALEKKVAVKVLAEEYAHLSEAVQRFFQEAKAASRIQHENIVAVTDFGRTPTGSVFLVMEYLEGKELAAHLKEHGAMAPERVRRVGLQLCDALQAAHTQGIIHRDMKPENIILLDHPGRPDFVKIVDFGIARMNVLERSAARLTCAGTVFGSPQYMAPEQARGEETDLRADIYAVGCILYETLTGTLPFRGTTVAALLSQHLFETPEPPRHRAPNRAIPQGLEGVVLKAIEKERERRFQSMKEMSAALATADPVVLHVPADFTPRPQDFMPRMGEATPRAQDFQPRLGEATPRAQDFPPRAAEFTPRPADLAPPRVSTPPPPVDVDALLMDAQMAVEDGLSRVALSLVDRAVDVAGGIDAGALQRWRELLERVYLEQCGDLTRTLQPDPAGPKGLDSQTAYLFSRVESWMTIEDLLDVSGMPRAVAAYRIAQLVRRGALVPQGAPPDRAGARG